jgi:hypothetical protein
MSVPVLLHFLITCNMAGCNIPGVSKLENTYVTLCIICHAGIWAVIWHLSLLVTYVTWQGVKIHTGILYKTKSFNHQDFTSILPTLPPLIPLAVHPSPSPLIRCSRRWADKAELTGGLKVYSRDDRRLKPLFPLWDKHHHTSCTPFSAQTRCLGCVFTRTNELYISWVYHSFEKSRKRIISGDLLRIWKW